MALVAAACASPVRDENTRTLTNAITSASWTEVGPLGSLAFGTRALAGRVNAITFDPTHNGTVYVGAAQGGVWKSTDDGQTFHTTTDHCSPAANCSAWTSLGVSSIAVATDGTVYVGTGDAPNVQNSGSGSGLGVMKSTDGGTSWTNVSDPAFNTHIINAIAVDPDDPNVVLAADFNCCNPGGTIWRSTNGGSSWNPWTAGTGPSWWTGLAFSPLTYVLGGQTVRDVYAIGEGNPEQIFWSNNHGANWTPLPVPTFSGQWEQRPLIAPSATSASTVWLALPMDNRVFVSRMHGQSWTEVTGNGSSIYNSQLDYTYMLATAQYDAQTDAVYAGSLNTFMHIDNDLVNGQPNWRAFENGHTDQHAVAADPSSPLPQRVMLGNDGGAFFATYQPTTQTFAVSSQNATLGIAEPWGIAISENDANAMVSAEQDNGLNVSAGSLSSWVNVATGDGGSAAIHPLTSSDRYGTSNIFLGCGALLRINGTMAANMDTSPMCSETRSDTAPLAFDPNHPSRLYFGTDYAWEWNVETQKWRSHVGGGTQLASSGALEAIAFAPSDPRRIYAGAYPTGQVWASFDEDNGPWTSLGTVSSGVTSIGVNPIRANQVFVGDSGANVWFGDVDGAPGTWTNLAPWQQLPSGEVHGFVFDPQSPDTICYVGTGSGVYEGTRTDSQPTWSATSTVSWTAVGPVNVPVRALEYSQLTGTMSVATFGRGIWNASLGTNARRQYVPFVGALVAWDGQCIGVKGGDNTTSGTHIVTNTCDGTSSQSWGFLQSLNAGSFVWSPPAASSMFMSVASDYTLQSVSSMNRNYPFTMVDVNVIGLNGYCMDVWGGNLVPGAVVGIYPCAGTANERWNFATDGSLRPAGTNLCVGTQSQPSGPPVLVLQACSTTAPNPHWTPRSGGSLISGDGYHCIDMDSVTGKGHSVACNGNEEQRWHMHGSIHAGGADCVDVWGASTAVGSTVGVYPCTAGAPNEAFDYYP
jgi:hypothetical protein